MLITTGPPKSGTSALRIILRRMGGLEQLPGALIYGAWKRHEDWIEQATGHVPKADVVKGSYSLPAEAAYAALTEGKWLHGHIPPPTPISVPTVAILRDPRAATISWFRAKQASKAKRKAEPTREYARIYRAWLRKGGGQRACDYIRPIYDGWLAEEPRDTLLIVRFEELFTAATLQALADFTGQDPVTREQVWNEGSKATGSPTRWEDWFRFEGVEDAFNEAWVSAADAGNKLQTAGPRDGRPERDKYIQRIGGDDHV
jgi:hypothetical protein